MPDLQQRAEHLAQREFVGGPVDEFERAGRLQLIALLDEGLTPQSKVLDVGCGCLRGGYWLIHFLNRGCYYGIEPNRDMLQGGLDEIIEPGLADEKEPAFAFNDDFDLTVFGEAKFDFILARSIWTHAAKPQIEKMLKSFSLAARPGGVLLTSYIRSRLRDYRGVEWVGRSHASDNAGLVAHSFRWIESTCATRGLRVEELGTHEMNNQRWLRIVL